MRKSVLLVGEPMGLFMADSVGELEKVESFSLTTCGAELNVAIGLKRLGHNVTYLTKLGNDLFYGLAAHCISLYQYYLEQSTSRFCH